MSTQGPPTRLEDQPVNNEEVYIAKQQHTPGTNQLTQNQYEGSGVTGQLVASPCG